MRSIKLIIGVISFFGAITFSSCQPKSSGGEAEQGSVSVEIFERKLNATPNAQVLDVRTPEEFLSGHLQNAININWNDRGFDSNVLRLDKSKPTFVYCLSGSRSANAARAMRNLGFKEIYEMNGGLMRWYNLSKPVVTVENSNSSTGMTLEEFKGQLNTEKLVLVDFNAPWCAPCKKMAPMLEEVSDQQKDNLMLVKINIDENKSLAKTLKVDALPTLILYKNGIEVWKQVGLIEKTELLIAIKKI